MTERGVDREGLWRDIVRNYSIIMTMEMIRRPQSVVWGAISRWYDRMWEAWDCAITYCM